MPSNDSQYVIHAPPEKNSVLSVVAADAVVAATRTFQLVPSPLFVAQVVSELFHCDCRTVLLKLICCVLLFDPATRT